MVVAASVAQNKLGNFHVSGHGSSGDHMLLIALAKPRFLVPISGTYHDMVSYREAAGQMGYKRNDIFLIENGQEVIFTQASARLGKKITINNVYVDQVLGEELETFVVRDRERLSKEGIIVIIAEVRKEDGQLAQKPDVVLRGSGLSDPDLTGIIQEVEKTLGAHKAEVTNWVHVRKMIADTASRYLTKKFRTRPLVLPVVIEV